MNKKDSQSQIWFLTIFNTNIAKNNSLNDGPLYSLTYLHITMGCLTLKLYLLHGIS